MALQVGLVCKGMQGFRSRRILLATLTAAAVSDGMLGHPMQKDCAPELHVTYGDRTQDIFCSAQRHSRSLSP